MSVQCAVPSCRTTYSLNSKDPQNKKISYHIFPKDEKLRQIWMKKCGRRNPFNIDHSFICSKHFNEEDYEHDIRREFLDLPTKKRLKSSAIPSRNLESPEDTVVSTKGKNLGKLSGRKQRYEQRERKKCIDDVLNKNAKVSKRSAEVNSMTSKITELKPPILKKKRYQDEDTRIDSEVDTRLDSGVDTRLDTRVDTREDSREDINTRDEIDATELQKLLNIILERIQCLEQELEGLTHIMEDIKGRIEKMQNRH